MPLFDLSGRRTMAGDIMSVQRSHGGYIYADRAEITQCDMVADNGVVHAVDRVILPRGVVDEPKIHVEDGAEEDASEFVAERSDSPFDLFKLFK